MGEESKNKRSRKFWLLGFVAIIIYIAIVSIFFNYYGPLFVSVMISIGFIILACYFACLQADFLNKIIERFE